MEKRTLITLFIFTEDKNNKITIIKAMALSCYPLDDFYKKILEENKGYITEEIISKGKKLCPRGKVLKIGHVQGSGYTVLIPFPQDVYLEILTSIKDKFRNSEKIELILPT